MPRAVGGGGCSSGALAGGGGAGIGASPTAGRGFRLPAATLPSASARDRRRRSADAARGRRSPRISFSIMARRSTTWPSVPCTASSASWVRAMSCLSSSTPATLSARRPPPSLLARISSIWTSRSAEPALDRFQMAEAGIGSVQLLDQLDDAVFEMADRDIVAARAAGSARSCRTATAPALPAAAAPWRRSARARPARRTARRCAASRC